MMNTVNSTDKIFATVRSQGNVVLNTTIEGARSFEEVIQRICMSLKGLVVGMVTLGLRNYTQGWSQEQALRLSRCSMPVAEAVQLSLF